MSSKPIISIIGLGLTGSSMGLGLKQQDGNFDVVGHDKNPDASKAASNLSAIDRTSWNLYKAVEDAEMIVLATPLDELEELLTLLRDDLREGTLVLAIAKVMQPALDLGARLLPDNVHFVVAHPVVAGIGGALTPRADLFNEVPFCLATSVDTDPTAMQLASDFVERVGASPLFMDVQEHDGLTAMVEQLPQFLAAVLLESVSNSASWTEGRRLAGRQFAQSTEMGSSPERLFHDLSANRDNLLTRIDQFQQTLDQWRALLVSDLSLESKVESVVDALSSTSSVEADPTKAAGRRSNENGDTQHQLLTALKRSSRIRDTWETQVILKNWDAEPLPDTPSASGFMQQMFFGNLFKGRGERVSSAEKSLQDEK